MQTIEKTLGSRRFPALIAVALAVFLLAAPSASADDTLSAPTLSATAGNGQVTLSWTESKEATDYYYRQSEDDGATWSYAGEGWILMSGTARTMTVTGLTNGTVYTFQVRGSIHAVSPIGSTNPVRAYSPASNAVTATPTE